MIAALYVLKDGPYFGIDGVDPWDEERDARIYDGPWPVVAHPPCKRWGRYWSGGPSAHGRFRLGDDNGCFDAALNAVKRFGGVLEHPEASHAWKRFHIVSPPRHGGWVPAGLLHPRAWTCCVEQGHYGHDAPKPTWLFYQGDEPPELRWGASGKTMRIEQSYRTTDERRRDREAGVMPVKRPTDRQRMETPEGFRDLLLGMAKSVQQRTADHIQESAAHRETQQ